MTASILLWMGVAIAFMIGGGPSLGLAALAVAIILLAVRA